MKAPITKGINFFQEMVTATQTRITPYPREIYKINIALSLVYIYVLDNKQ